MDHDLSTSMNNSTYTLAAPHLPTASDSTVNNVLPHLLQ